MNGYTIANDSSHLWATWTVYQNGVRMGCFYNRAECAEWIRRHSAVNQRVE